MEEQPLRSNAKKVLRALTPRFASSNIRTLVMNSILSTIMLDILSFGYIKQGVTVGLLPWYSLDVMIVAIVLLEVLCVFLFAGAFPLRRRTVIQLCLLGSAGFALGLPFLSAISWEGPELCTSGLFGQQGYGSAATRLAVISVISSVNAAARAGIWAHGVILIEEMKARTMSTNYGVLLAVRISALVIFPRLISADYGIWHFIVPNCVVMQIVHLLQFFRVPEPYPPGKTGNEYGSYSSVGRILSSPLVSSQIVGMSFLAAALWGFGYYEQEIVKTKFLINESVDIVNGLHMLGYIPAIIVCVILAASFFKTENFSYEKAAKKAFVSSLVAVIIYSVLTFALGCARGAIGGLSPNGGNFTQPPCSLQCSCSVPSDRFAPVCVTDSMTTYISPCHAGCSKKESVDGIEVYRECGCAPGQGLRSAAQGACANAACAPTYRLHVLFYAVTVLCTALGLQGQAMNILRSVRPEDRSMAIGITATGVLLFTHCFAHIGYTSIAAWTCSWFSAGGACILQNTWFPTYVGAASVTLAGLSTLINLIAFCCLRRNNNGHNSCAARSVFCISK